MGKGGVSHGENHQTGQPIFDGQPQETGARYDSGRIAFGPAIPGKELQWVKVNGLLVADRCVCINRPLVLNVKLFPYHISASLPMRRPAGWGALSA